MGCVTSSEPQQPQSIENSNSTRGQQVQSSSRAEKIVENVIIADTSEGNRDINFTSGLIFTEAQQNKSDISISIFSSIKRGDLDALKLVVSQEFRDGEISNIHVMKGMWDSTPLMVAIQYHHVEIVQFLLAYPPKDESILNHRNEKGATAILLAVIEGMEDVVEKLISLKAIVNILPTCEAIYNPHYDQLMISTPLSVAICNNELGILQLLLSNGCNVDQKFDFSLLKSNSQKKSSGGPTKSHGIVGLTPISLSCFYGHVGIARELLSHSCDCYTTDNESNSILHHLGRSKATSSGETSKSNEGGALHPIVEIFQLFQLRKIVTEELLEGEDGNGDVPLHVACENKQIEYVKLLLQEGCNPSRMNHNSGFTPLHIAVKRRSLPIIECLLEYGADPLAKKNETAQSPYDLCLKLPKTSEVFLAMDKAASAWKAMRGAISVATPSPPDAVPQSSIIVDEVLSGNSGSVPINEGVDTAEISLSAPPQCENVQSSQQTGPPSSVTGASKGSPLPLAVDEVIAFPPDDDFPISAQTNSVADENPPNSSEISGCLKQDCTSPAEDVGLENGNEIENEISLIDLPPEVGSKQTNEVKTTEHGGDPVSEFSVLDESMAVDSFDPLAHRFATVTAESRLSHNRLDMYIKSYNPSLLLRARDEEDEEGKFNTTSDNANEDDEKSFMLLEKRRMKTHDHRNVLDADSEAVSNKKSRIHADNNTIMGHDFVALAETIASELFDEVSEKHLLNGNHANVGVKKDNISKEENKVDGAKVESLKVTPKQTIPKPPSNSFPSAPPISSAERKPPSFRRRQLASTSTATKSVGIGVESTSDKGEEVRKTEAISQNTTTNRSSRPPRNNPPSTATSTTSSSSSSSFRNKPQPPKGDLSSTSDINSDGSIVSKTSSGTAPNSSKSLFPQPSPLHRRKLVAK